MRAWLSGFDLRMESDRRISSFFSRSPLIPPHLCLSGRPSLAELVVLFSHQFVEVALDMIDQRSLKRLQQKTESDMEPDFRIGHVHLAIDT